MTETLPTQELDAEHAMVLSKAEELAEGVARLENSAGGAWAEVGADLQARLKQMEEILLLHFRKEEEGLFPDVLSMVSRGAPRVDILSEFFGEEADDDLKAHMLLRSRLRDLGELLQKGEEAGRIDAALAARLGTVVSLTKDLLVRHARKEQELVFPMIARLLDESQMAAVKDRLRAIARGQ